MQFESGLRRDHDVRPAIRGIRLAPRKAAGLEVVDQRNDLAGV
jgi:hypothetical protein